MMSTLNTLLSALASLGPCEALPSSCINYSKLNIPI